MTTVVWPCGLSVPVTGFGLLVENKYPFGFVVTIGGLPSDTGVTNVMTSEETLPEELPDTTLT